MNKLKKILTISLFCYLITAIIFTAILFLGLSGRFRGVGYAYRLLSFYIIIPGTVGVTGFVLGIYNIHKKWIYPFFSVISSFIIYYIIHQRFLTTPVNTFYFLFPFIFSVTGLGIGIWVYKMRPENKIRLRRVTKIAMIIGAVITSIHIIHAFTLDRIIEYTEVSFYSANIAPEFSGYRIAFIADIHYISDERLWNVVDELNRRELDLAVLGGDFATYKAPIQRAVYILSHIEAADGIYGVEGNHDNYIYLFPAMEAHGIIPLSNCGRHIREGFFLAGVEDLWNRNPSISDALEGSLPEDFVLLISHNPDITMQQDTTKIDLILSGHTHGGQFTFFGIWAPYFTARRSITAYGQRFCSDWALSYDGVPVFVRLCRQ